MYPTFNYSSPYGIFSVTVLDPTPAAGKRDHETGPAFTLRTSDEGVKINGIVVTVRADYHVRPERNADGTPTGTVYAWTQYGIHRVTDDYSKRDAVPDGVRNKLREVANAIANGITDEQRRDARAENLTQYARRKREEAKDLREKAALADREAERLETDALYVALAPFYEAAS